MGGGVLRRWFSAAGILKRVNNVTCAVVTVIGHARHEDM